MKIGVQIMFIYISVFYPQKITTKFCELTLVTINFSSISSAYAQIHENINWQFYAQFFFLV